MAEQVYFEDVEVGMEIPPLTKGPSNLQLFLYSSVTRNPHRIHYDKEYAATEDHPEVVVHGPLQGAWLASLCTNWVSPGGWLKKISYQNRARSLIGDTMTCRGRITKKHLQNGENIVELEVWEENQRGEVCAPGSAVVRLPSRG